MGCDFCSFLLILSMRENWFPLAEHTQKLVICWLGICENHFGALRTFSEFFLSSCPCPSVPFSRPSLTSYVFCLSLYLVSRPMSPVLPLCSVSSVLCLLSHVSVLFASRPVSPVLRLYGLLQAFFISKETPTAERR
jgi:hypothetical protein